MRVEVNGIQINVVDTGPKDAPAVVFSHALGVTLEVWDAALAHLPDGLRLIRYDMRGHGQSDVPPAPYSMGQLIADAEGLLDVLNVRDAVFVGSSIGGMIAQGLAIKRLDQIRALVLSNTAAKLGVPAVWDTRMTPNPQRRSGKHRCADIGAVVRSPNFAPRMRPPVGATPSSIPTRAAIWGAAPPYRERIFTHRPRVYACPALALRGATTAPRPPIWCAKPLPSFPDPGSN